MTKRLTAAQRKPVYRAGYPGSDAIIAPVEFTAEPYSLRFEIQGLPKINASDGLHWRTRQRMREAWEQAVWIATTNRRPPTPLRTARLTITRHSSAQPDYDGLVQTGKWLIDALVKLGVLEDDAPSVIGVPTYRWQLASPRQGKVAVYVEAPGTTDHRDEWERGPDQRGVEIGERINAKGDA